MNLDSKEDGNKNNAPTDPVDSKTSIKELEEMIIKETNELKNKYLSDGPFVYELYGVMLHSGGAYGGHYSAYIKDLEREALNIPEKDAWHHFNDSHVSKISITELASVFGKQTVLSN